MFRRGKDATRAICRRSTAGHAQVTPCRNRYGVHVPVLWPPAVACVFDTDGQMGSEELRQRMRLLDNEIRIMRSDTDRIRHESTTQVSK